MDKTRGRFVSFSSYIQKRMRSALNSFFFIAILMWISSTDLGAFHIIGGEITYECLGPGSQSNTRSYRFKMYIYRDCLGGGADLDPEAFIGIWSGNRAPYSFIGKVIPVLVGPNMVDPPIIECLIPPDDICVEEGSYTWTVDLPIINDSYHISYQRCCRNSSISNIVNPDRIGATFAVELTSLAQSVCNNSATFTNFPPTVICVSEPLSFDHSAIDVDGDSLVYEFCSPKLGAGREGTDGNQGDPNSCEGVRPDPGCAPPYGDVNFRLPVYTFRQPMAGDPVVSIDPVTGEITGVPLTLGQFVVGVCVSEYRDGLLINTLSRDFQFNVEDCESTVVAQIQADETVGVKDFLLTSCGEETINFVNESFVESQISSYLWQFDVGEGQTEEATTRDATITFPRVGLYSGKLYLNKNSICEDSASITVRILPGLEADFEFSYDTCEVGPVVFDNFSTTEAASIISHEWQFNNEGVSSLIDPIYNFLTPGVKAVSLAIVDNNGCTDVITRNVDWRPAPQTIIIQPNTFLGCEPANITFTNLSFPIDDNYTFNWTFGDGTTGDELSPDHLYLQSGVYDIGLEIISPIGCQVAASFASLIRVEPGPIADFDISPDEFTSINNTASFTDRSQNAVSWFWDFDRESFSTLEHPTYTFRDTGLQEIKLIVTRDNGCQDTIVKVIDVVPIVMYHMPNAFTPNNDGANETFFGKGRLDGIKDFEFTIWNRWGERIFQTSDPDEGWNGRTQNVGELAPIGSYMYLVTYVGPRGELHKLKGNANLIR